MVECPVCGVLSQSDQLACGVCGLPTALFEEFREVAQPPPEPQAAGRDDIRGPSPGESSGSRPAQAPVRRPSLSSGASTAPLIASPLPSSLPVPPMSRGPPPPPEIVPEMSMRMGAEEIEVARERSKESSAQLHRRRRELISSVLEALIDRYRKLCDRRDVFSSVIRTQALDAELAAYRKALGNGEIPRAEEHRRKATRQIRTIEGSWMRISSLIGDANQMIRALRELGGVAPSVLRPVADAVRVPRRAEAVQIERRLKRASDLLWKLLAPRLEHEVAKCRAGLVRSSAPAAQVELVRSEIERFAEKVRARKVSEALDARRFLRAEMSSLGPRAPRRPAGRFSIDQTHRS